MDKFGKRGQPDRSKINMHEDYEVKYWTHELGVTPPIFPLCPASFFLLRSFFSWWDLG
jgi:hypothetical protein